MGGIAASCCAIDTHIRNASGCTTPKAGIHNSAYVVCLANLQTVTETDCSASDAIVTDIVTGLPGQAPSDRLYEMEMNDKTGDQMWELLNNYETGQTTINETFKFDTHAKTRAVYCSIEDYIGQEVAIIWQERGTDRWYISGRAGGLRLTSVTGGTGTTEIKPIQFTFEMKDGPKKFIEIFDTDAATTNALITSLVAA